MNTAFFAFVALTLGTVALPAQRAAKATETAAPGVVAPAVDSTKADTMSSRARRVRAPRPPRPGIFTSLDSARTMPDSVIYLNLRGKGLTSVQGLAAFKNAQVIDLSGNALTSFPQELLKLSKVTSIDLSENAIKTVPAEIGSLTGLTRLTLRNTGISTLPTSIGGCIALTVLDVSGNPLESLPIKELNRLPRLRTLTIGGLKQTDAQPFVPQDVTPAKTQPGGGKTLPPRR